MKRDMGFTLIEAVISVAVVSVVLMSVAGISTFLSKASFENTAKIQAAFLAEEGLEVMRILRDDDWTTNIASQSAGVPFFLIFNSGSWQKTTEVFLIDGVFERSVVLTDVYRDGSFDIVSSGGTLDPNTKKFTVSVSWFSGGATTTRSLSTYLAKLQ